MNHRLYLAFALAAIVSTPCSLAAPPLLADEAKVAWEPPAGSAEERIAAVIDYMKTVDLESMKPLPAKKHTFPEPSIHVMRVHLDEFYSLDGIGSDRVSLTGWIAVRQDAARSTDPSSKQVSWRNGIVNTEFVGLELRGESDLFGTVEVTLDPATRALGQVGSFALPEEVDLRLRAFDTSRDREAGGFRKAGDSEKSDLRDEPGEIRAVGQGQSVYAQDRTPLESVRGLTDEESKDISREVRARIANERSKACRSGISIVVRASKLDLEMKTKNPVVWYSRVDSIPPVGYTASIALTPTPLVSKGRQVGTLVSGKVNFRELVLSVPLEVAKKSDVQD